MAMYAAASDGVESIETLASLQSEPDHQAGKSVGWLFVISS